MKRWIAGILALLLTLACAGAWAESPEDAAVQAPGPEGEIINVPCTKEGVPEFMAALTLAGDSGTFIYGNAGEAACYNVTPERVAAETDIQIFKFSDSCQSFALVDGAAYDLGGCFGGYGFLNAVPWDYDGDDQIDLLVASSWGSGIHRTEISVFIRAEKTAKVLYSTMYDSWNAPDLAVSLDEDIGEAALMEVQVLFQDYDFAHLSFRVIGPYQPSYPLVTRAPQWNPEAASSLLGAWYCTMDEEFGVSMSMTFLEDGSVMVSAIDLKNLVYADAAGQYWADENILILEDNGSQAVYFDAGEDELRLQADGDTWYVFARVTEEDRAWMDTLRPKYQPGDVSQAEISYGTSEYFTREQMDAALAVVQEEFLSWYGCTLLTLSYTSDEWSAREFASYAEAERMKTGKTYVDGIVFTSSFLTPPEAQSDPNLGLMPEEEYTGWNWILLLTDDGVWELVDC